LSAMGVGVLVWLFSSFMWPDLPGDLIGMGACLITMLIVVPLSQKSDPPLPLLSSDGEQVELSDRLGVLR